MKRMLVVAMIVLAGCGEVIVPPAPARPGAPAPDPLEAIETLPPDYADGAIRVALASLGEQSGLAVPTVRVRWTSEPIPWNNSTAAGLTWSCADIWVYLPGLALDENVQAHDTSLAHELAHCVRLAGLGDGDGGHLDPAWWTQGQGFVFHAVEALRSAGY